MPSRHNPDRLARPGPSGHPGWQEGAVYFVQALGAPPDVWNTGISDYARDINSRPLYANWIDADVVVSIHNNGGGGTGTETWYDETNRRIVAYAIRDSLHAWAGLPLPPDDWSHRRWRRERVHTEPRSHGDAQRATARHCREAQSSRR